MQQNRANIGKHRDVRQRQRTKEYTPTVYDTESEVKNQEAPSLSSNGAAALYQSSRLHHGYRLCYCSLCAQIEQQYKVLRKRAGLPVKALAVFEARRLAQPQIMLIPDFPSPART